MYARVKTGTNVVNAVVEDKPAVFLSTDPRPLLLHVESLKLAIEPNRTQTSVLCPQASH